MDCVEKAAEVMKEVYLIRGKGNAESLARVLKCGSLQSRTSLSTDFYGVEQRGLRRCHQPSFFLLSVSEVSCPFASGQFETPSRKTKIGKK